MQKFDFVDSYRERNKSRKEGLYLAQIQYLEQGQLDYFIISADLYNMVAGCFINPGYKTINSLVTLTMTKQQFNNLKLSVILAILRVKFKCNIRGKKPVCLPRVQLCENQRNNPGRN